MKSKFLRMISMILILASLFSLFSVVLATAESVDLTDDTDDTTDDTASSSSDKDAITLLYNRTYDEGWDIENGMTMPDKGRGSYFTIDYETSYDFSYNYFFRFEVGSKLNGYTELTYNGASGVGSVLEFDIKTDDITNINSLIQFGSLGGSDSVRSDYTLMSIVNNEVQLFSDKNVQDDKEYSDVSAYVKEYYGVETGKQYTPFTLGNKWMTFKLVFDYTYVHEPILDTDSDSEVNRKTELNEKWFQLYVWFGPADGSEELTLLTDGPITMYGRNGKGLQMVRFATQNAAEADFGTSVCFDNIRAYTGINKIVDVSDMGYGSKVDPDYTMTVEILGSANTNAVNALENALSMKVGVDYCYSSGSRQPIYQTSDGEAYGAPVKIGDNVAIPFYKLLEYINYDYYVHPDGKHIDIATGKSATYIVIGKNTATVGKDIVTLNMAPTVLVDEDGHEGIYIAVSDFDTLFPGYYADYDDMGLITISQTEDLIDRNRNLVSMLNIMKEFIFDYPEAETLYSDVEENTNGFQHPYIYGTQDLWDEMYNEYQTLNNKVLNGTLSETEGDPEEYELWVHYERLVGTNVWSSTNGHWAYLNYSYVDEDGNFLGLKPDYDEDGNLLVFSTSYTLDPQYTDSYGYDPQGGRSSGSSRTQHLESLAISYMLTRNINYLKCAYEIAIKMGQWEHWGPGHFLDCAETSAPFAVFYDLTYNAYNEMRAQGITRADGTNYSTATLANILYEKGAYEGYRASVLVVETEYVSPIVGTGGSLYIHRENNWNAVCTSGMLLASLAILGDMESEDIRNKLSQSISVQLESLPRNGLDMYAPDGSYVEGPGYWEYGTNKLFKLCMVLETAAGTTYGLMDTWGIDTTCYFVSHAESSDGRTFPFADGHMEQIDSSYFFYVAGYFDDATIYTVRMAQLTSGVKWATIIDLLNYPRDGIPSDGYIRLDYVSEALNLYTARDSWESGALYAAMRADENYSSAHNQIEAGGFVYHNGGIPWIVDLGTENYNVVGFWSESTRYRYYVMKPEGNNTIAISTDPSGTPYGQRLDGNAKIDTYDSNEYGSYIVYNMQDALRGTASSWERGMMLTNDRKTTIIQDQLSFYTMQNAYWFAHFSYSYITDYVISDDGRTVYLRKAYTDENEEVHYTVLRVQLLSARKDLKFEIWDTYTFIHKKGENDMYTYEKEYAIMNGRFVPENDRSNAYKLVVNSGMCLDFNIAVVIEMLDEEDITKDQLDVGYTYTDMSEWEPGADLRGTETDDEETVVKRGTPNAEQHINQSAAKIKTIMLRDNPYVVGITQIYRYISDGYYAIKAISTDLPSKYYESRDYIEDIIEEYNKYRKEVESQQNIQHQFANYLLGL